MRRLPTWLLVSSLALLPGDQTKAIDEPVSCALSIEDRSTIDEVLSIDGFRSAPVELMRQAEWPQGVTNPMASIQPTFDDGPHLNDSDLVQLLKHQPFRTPIFYYNGARFFKAEYHSSIETIEAGQWMAWVDKNRAELSREEFLTQAVDLEMLRVAKEIHENGFEIGFHGMTHAPVDSPGHLQNMNEDNFRNDIEFYEWLIQVLIDHEYELEHVRPPYGAGNDSWRPYVKVCEERGIEVRNWSFSSFDWEEFGEVDGDGMLTRVLRTVNSGKQPDILYHSQHQKALKEGSFTQLVDVWAANYLSILQPERSAERAAYKSLLTAIIAEDVIANGNALIESPLSLGSSAQVMSDSAYNRGLYSQWAGIVQLNMSNTADGYLGPDTAKELESVGVDSIKVAETPNSLIAKLDLEIPKPQSFCEPGVSFGNRGLQVKSMTDDILEAGAVTEDFLESYRFAELHIDPENIPVYVEMYDFYIAQGLSQTMSARLVATALIETGLKNGVDKWLFGKSELEDGVDALHKLDIPVDLVRRLHLYEIADTLEYGPSSVGPAQINLDAMTILFSLILEKDLSREEVREILETPKGAAFGLYLTNRQIEQTMLSDRI
jgi:hypothetical protein